MLLSEPSLTQLYDLTPTEAAVAARRQAELVALLLSSWGPLPQH